MSLDDFYEFFSWAIYITLPAAYLAVHGVSPMTLLVVGALATFALWVVDDLRKLKRSKYDD